MPLRVPSPPTTNPLAPHPRRPRRRVAGRTPRVASSWIEASQHRAHRADAARSALSAARGLRGARTDLRDPDLPRDQRVHARPRGEPVHPRHRPRQVPVARRQPRRPDPADRRRPSDHGRRVPRPRAAGHAAAVPPRAHRRRGRDHDRGGRAGARGLADGGPGRPLRLDAARGDAGGDAGPVRASTPIGPASTSPRPSSAVCPSTSASTSFRCCADRGARSPACAASAAPWTGSSSARSPAGDGPARRARTSSAC